MDQKQFAENYLMANARFFPADKIAQIKDKLSHLPEDRQTAVQSLQLKNPTTTFLLSWFLGGFGADRYYLGDIGLGILKFLSIFLIVGFIWIIIDIFLCYKKTRQVNFKRLMLLI